MEDFKDLDELIDTITRYGEMNFQSGGHQYRIVRNDAYDDDVSVHGYQTDASKIIYHHYPDAATLVREWRFDGKTTIEEAVNEGHLSLTAFEYDWF